MADASDHAAFIAAIIARPDDDLPRLIYADWLDEHARVECRGPERCPKCGGVWSGYKLDSFPVPLAVCNRCHYQGPPLQDTEPTSNGYAERAEFIRVQCELEALRRLGCHEGESCNVTGQCAECGREVRAVALRRRERELLAMIERQFISQFPVAMQVALDPRHRPKPIVFRHGFVESVTCSAADWLRYGNTIFAVTPIREVTIRPCPYTGRQLDKAMLESRWPQIKTWHLPTGDVTSGQPPYSYQWRRSPSEDPPDGLFPQR